MDRPGTCIILDKKYNIANSSFHFGSYGSVWTGLSPKKYYMDLRSFGDGPVHTLPYDPQCHELFVIYYIDLVFQVKGKTQDFFLHDYLGHNYLMNYSKLCLFSKLWQDQVIQRAIILLYNLLRLRVIVFNATFNNISVISWQLALLVEETGGLGAYLMKVISERVVRSK